MRPVHHSTATAAWLKKPTEKEKEIGHIILVYSICIYRRQKKIFCRYIPSIASHWCVSSTLGGCYFNYLVVLFYLLQLMMLKIWIPVLYEFSKIGRYFLSANFQFCLEFNHFVCRHSKSIWNYFCWYIHCVAKVYAVLPFYDVKCLCSGGWEWGREESHSH